MTFLGFNIHAWITIVTVLAMFSVLLHNGKGGTLYKLKGKGPRFWAKADLEKKGFTDLAHDYYLVYEFDTAKSAEYPHLPSLARGKQTTSPWFATWEILMEKKE